MATYEEAIERIKARLEEIHAEASRIDMTRFVRETGGGTAAFAALLDDPAETAALHARQAERAQAELALAYFESKVSGADDAAMEPLAECDSGPLWVTRSYLRGLIQLQSEAAYAYHGTLVSKQAV